MKFLLHFYHYLYGSEDIIYERSVGTTADETKEKVDIHTSGTTKSHGCAMHMPIVHFLYAVLACLVRT